MPDGTYGGERRKETKVGQKTFASQMTRSLCPLYSRSHCHQSLFTLVYLSLMPVKENANTDIRLGASGRLSQSRLRSEDLTVDRCCLFSLELKRHVIVALMYDRS